MRRVLTAAVLAPLVLALVMFAPQVLITLVVAAVGALAGWEFLGLAEHCGAKPPRFAVMAAVLALFAGNYQWPDQTLIILGALSLSLVACCTFRTPVERVLLDACSSVFALFYIGLTLLAIPTLRAQTNGPSLVIFLLFVVWAGDITALYVGRLWGKKKMAPAISPNKTWVGAVGSVLGSVLVTVGLYWLSLQLVQWNFTKLSFTEEAWWYWLVMAVVVNVAAQVGDLAESALKRSAGVKDSGSLLPGHGGVLDRIDALLIAAPVLWWLQALR
ncbi:MAG TPA: phosphatidate cytidylyltransferase [Terracidiphilus sp.]|jgi:phosphatidate cytidylyltransferase|nr:phosphatidate cytidylyltransferase [Terracidiphilus sp.]